MLMESPSPYTAAPPVMSVEVDDPMDIMIVRNTTRHAAALVGFSPAHRAQLSSASATLAELVLKTGDAHTIRLNGVRHRTNTGLQISLDTPWLAGVSANNVLIALRSKLGELVDEIMLTGEDSPTIIMVMWLTPSRSGSNSDLADDNDD